jgi:hypothetical protein
MHPTSAKPTHAAEPAAIFSAPPTSTIHPTTEPFSTSPKYSRQSCPVQLRPNSGHYTPMHVRQSQCANSLQRLATNNPRPPSKQTTPLHLELPTTTSNHNAPKPWTCVSTGFVVATPKGDSGTTGPLGPTTLPTTGASTTAPLTTLRRGQKSYLQNS